MQRKTLVVGNSSEAALLAMLTHATEVRTSTRDSELLLASQVLWARSLLLATDVASKIAVDKILLDGDLIRDGQIIVDGCNRIVPVDSIAGALEERFGRVWAEIDETPEEFAHVISKPSRLEVLLTRGMDTVLAGIGLIITTPFLLLFSMVYRLVLGPARFFRTSIVVGKNEATFTSKQFLPHPQMLVANSRSERVANSLERNIRRMHLNGVPCLVQVLTGQLALVGPMPTTLDVHQKAVDENPLFRARTLVRPGLISLARVRLRNATSDYDTVRALEYDLFYIKHRTFWFDLRILARALTILVSDIVVTTGRMLKSAVVLSSRMVRRKLIGGYPRGAALAPPPMPVGIDGRSKELTPVLLIGAGAGAELLISELQSNHHVGLWPVAAVDDNTELVGTKIKGVPVLGTTATTNAIVARERIKQVIIATPSATPAQMQRLSEIARKTGLDVSAMPPIGRILQGTEPTALVPVPVKDLLGRPIVEIDPVLAKGFLGGKRVLVTGAVGSIGREVVFQALRGEPEVIYGLDINESDLYDLQQELKRRNFPTTFVPVIGSVCDNERIEELMWSLRPHVVFHAAAYKHVPLMEDYPREAVRTNIRGTWAVATASARVGVERFVLVSTDKAVHPTSAMGASKRVAELVVQEIAQETGLSACAVRFGNVLGSRGSVIPLFERQIEDGGPVTITDPGMVRYFMTIPEAAGLIIEAGAFGDRAVVYMLDMGEPVRILDLAHRLIQLKGLRPGIDIEIAYTGLRPGEKLFEELALDFEQARPTPHPKIRVLVQQYSPANHSAQQLMTRLLDIVDDGDADEIRAVLLQSVQAIDTPDHTVQLDAIDEIVDNESA